MLMVTVGEFVTEARANRRDALAGAEAAATYQAAFERLDRMARELRAERWAEGAAEVQRAAEVAWYAARAERRAMQEGANP